MPENQKKSTNVNVLGQVQLTPPPSSTASHVFSGRTVLLLAALFIITGGTALLAEQIFEKMLSTVIGASTPAGTIVTGIYFAGFALGSFGYRKLAGRIRRPLLFYGVAEGAIGFWTLIIVLFFAPLLTFSAQLINLAGDSATAIFWLRLLVACLLILPPVTAMGASFPAIIGAIDQLELPNLRLWISRFYALNLLGAMAATLAAPYLLFPLLGLTGSLWLIAILNTLVVLATWVLGRDMSARDTASTTAPYRPKPLPSATDRVGAPQSSDQIILLLLAFASGYLFFSFEVLWLHLLGAIIGTSAFAFSNMLFAVLAGLFLGGCCVTIIHRRYEVVPTGMLALVLLATGALLALVFLAWDKIPLLMIKLGEEPISFAKGEMFRIQFALLLSGLPATLMGMIFPLLFRISWFPLRHADRTGGLLVGTNAIGSLLGALVTGFFLIPVYGSETSYRFLTLVPICIGLLLIIPGMKDGKRPTTKAITSILGASLAIALTLPMVNSSWNRLRITSGTNVYFSPGYVEQDTELLFFHEDIYGGFTTVVRNRTTDQVSTTLLTNGKFQANDTGEVPIQISFALLPALHQKNRDRALVIGLGSGQTANAVAATGYQHIDIAEIAPGIVAAAQQEFLHINNNVLSRSHVKLHIEDGRNQLLRSRSRYDLITIELNSVWFAGSTNLYSREFYALAKQRLTSGGILLQWIQLHHISTPELITILATVRAEFPYVSLSVVQGTGLILASASPLGLDNVAMEEMAQRPELAELLSSPFITLANAQVDELAVKRILMSLSRLQLLNAAEITRLAAVAEEKRLPLNTDGNRFIEFSTPRHNLEQHDHRKVNINNLFEFVTPSRRSQQAARFGIDLP